MSGFFQKYKFLLCLGVALFCALIYDYCRNLKDEQTISIKPPETEKPNDLKPRTIIGDIEATELFTEFTTNEKEAREKYIGKTFLITGRISEVFSSKTMAEYFPGDRERGNYVEGIMLFPETKEAINNLSKSGGELSKFPELISFDRDEHIIPEQKDESGLTIREFSHKSKYGGVYCVLPIEYKFEDFSQNKNLIKKKIEVKCRVIDYKKGGKERVYARDPRKPRDPYATADDELIQGNYIETSVGTQNRVILTDCKELSVSSEYE